jgi:hypothetical protein
MLQSDQPARSFRIRAVFLSAALLPFLTIVSVLSSCAPAAFSLEEAKLYPAYLYDPALSALVPFVSVSLTVESGDLDISSLELQHLDSGLTWAYSDSFFPVSTDRPVIRQPSGDEDYSPPDYYADSPGARQRILYPWFAIPEDLASGRFRIRARDLAMHESEIDGEFTSLRAASRTALAEALAESSPERMSLNGSWEIIVTDATSGEVIQRLLYENLLAGEGPDSPESGAGTLWYVWGVPLEYDCFVLLGPFIR